MHYLISFSFKNITRNKRRTALTLIGITLAVAVLIMGNSVLNGVLNQVLEAAMKSSGHISIQTKEYTKSERLLPLDKGIDNLQGLMETLKKYSEIEYAVPRLNFGGLFVTNDESYAAFGSSIDPVLESSFIRLANNIVAGSYFTGGTNEAVIGLEIAKKLFYKPGDTVLLVSRNSYNSIAAKKLKIVGIADFNMFDLNRTFYIDLKTASDLLKINDSPQKVIVILKNQDDMNMMKWKLLRDPFIKESGLQVFKADEVGLFQTMFPIIFWIFRFVMLIFLLAATMTIANTMMMTVLERTAEIGVLEAMGMKRYTVILMVVLEAAVIGLIGSLIGALAGGSLAFYLKKTGILLGENIAKGMPIPMKNVIYPGVNVSLILTIMAVGIGISMIAGAVPAILKLRKLKPAEAIRTKG